MVSMHLNDDCAHLCQCDAVVTEDDVAALRKACMCAVLGDDAHLRLATPTN